METRISDYESWQRKQDRMAQQYTTLTLYLPRGETKVNGIPVMIHNGWVNVWAWVDPITEYEQHIARNGGYFETRRREWRGQTV